jgi:kynurenine formamidase
MRKPRNRPPDPTPRPPIRCDLTLPHYFGYAPAPMVETRPVIPRREPRGLFMRGEFGIKEDGALRPIVAHNTTHLDVPFHFIEAGADLASLLNRPDSPADRPALARIVWLAGERGAGTYSRDGIAYCEEITAGRLPPPERLSGYEALVVITGFGALMARRPETRFAPDGDGRYHVPHLTDNAVERILASGVRLVALDSTTIEPQTATDPVRFGSDVHFCLLGAERPVLVVEGLNGAGLRERLGFAPEEGLLHVVARRVNAEGADAAHARVFLYCYRGDPGGAALRRLADLLRVEEMHG